LDIEIAILAAAGAGHREHHPIASHSTRQHAEKSEHRHHEAKEKHDHKNQLALAHAGGPQTKKDEKNPHLKGKDRKATAHGANGSAQTKGHPTGTGHPTTGAAPATTTTHAPVPAKAATEQSPAPHRS
jgi:hypothetical protein